MDVLPDSTLMPDQPLPHRPMVFTATEVAAALGRHPETIRRMARAGHLPMFRLGGRWVMHRRDLYRLVRQEGRSLS